MKKLEIFQHHIMVASANGWTAPEIHSHLRWLIREPDTRSQNSHATRRCRGCPLKMLSHTICCLHNPESKKIHGQVLRTVEIGILSTLCEVNLYTQCPRRKPLFTKWHKGHIKGSLMNIGNTLLAIWNQNELCRIFGMGLARTTTVTA